MKARQHFYVEGHTRGIPLNEDEEPTVSNEPAYNQVEEPSLYQKFEQFCSGFIDDGHRERYEKNGRRERDESINEVERQYLGDDIEDVGAPAGVWEEQEDAFNTYFKSRRLSTLCLVWEDYGFWKAFGMMRLRVMYQWTLFRDTLFDKFLPKSVIFSYSRILWKLFFLVFWVILFFPISSIWIRLLVHIPLAFLLARMCFAPRHEVYEKHFRTAYFEDWNKTRLENEKALSEEDE